MKKLMILLTVSSLICGLAFAGGKGAIKVDLCVSDSGTPVKPVVGWVVFNVNANGVVIAEMHINDGEEGTYDVKLNADDDTPGGVENLALVGVTINKAGKGNAHLSGDLGDNTQVRVNVLPVGASGQPNQIFTTGWVTL